MKPVGAEASVFTLKDQHGQTFSLSENSGKKLLLSFHPLAWTSVCREQMLSLEANYDRFSRANTIPLGLSIDSVPSKKAWSDSMNLQQLRLLADFWPHGFVARLYDVFRDKDGFSERANIIIDQNQKIAFVKIYPISHLPEIEEILQFVESN